MPASSMLARIQQVITLTLLALASAWLVWRWPASPWQAIAGFGVIALGYSIFLAIEFVALRFVGRSDPAPQPSWGDLVRAWWGETLDGPRVFCWRQPFRWRAVPDYLDTSARGRRGAVFVHGFVCNRGFWTPWLLRMRAQGHPFIAVNLEPVFGSIDDYAPILEDAVQRVTQATGLAPILVCHSMGGLAARAWLRAMPGMDRVHRVVTIGTPHQGTWLGRFSHLSNGLQMRLKSEWLERLYAVHPHDVPFTCWYSNCDNIVFPATTATLPRADNRLVRGVAHVHLAFQPEVMDETFALLDAPDEEERCRATGRP